MGGKVVRNVSQGKSKPERRRHPRAITSFSAVLTVSVIDYSARVINLSMGGALLDFARVVPEPPINVGDRVLVNIRCRDGAGPVVLEGRAVLWHLKSDSAPLLAVQFDEVTGENEEILEELIEEALAEIGGRAVKVPVDLLN